MDALLSLFAALVTLFAAAGLSATLGVDSRDGFTEDRFGTSFR